MQPSTQPSGCPSAQPSALPSAQPSSIPSAVPSSQPSSQPSAQPTMVPSGQPTAQPTGVPSGQPTGQPSSEPSGQPSGVPSSQPSGQPSSKPSGQPSSYPTDFPTTSPASFPSTLPTSEPTGQPSLQPSGQPTRQPSGQPTRQPSSAPSTQPSSVPTRQPTGQPSTQPSSQPSGQPSSIPSGQPSAQPSSQPSGQPSSIPSGQPSAQPSSQPSGQPSSIPSGQPTSLPSSQPSTHPTAQPSCQPSSVPTSQPSDKPTSQPTSIPSGKPTAQPSRCPTSQPSGQPSSVPSSQPSSCPTSQPSVQPTTQPTSRPTSRDEPRFYNCAEDIVCQSYSNEDCRFASGAIFFVCAGETNCQINAGSLSIGPNTNLTVIGNCSLNVFASQSIVIQSSTIIQGRALNFTSAQDITVYGTLTTTGQGPWEGPGSVSRLGAGGSYGGSGGSTNCTSAFANVESQIGTLSIFEDVRLPAFVNPTFGSGGGYFNHSGQGGGRVILHAEGVLKVYSSARIDAEGSPAVQSYYGAGSGGSIAVQAYNLTLQGHLSVKGGNGDASLMSPAGGGGRIAISLFGANSFVNAWTNLIDISGGGLVNTTVLSSGSGGSHCLLGGAGTLFVTLSSYSTVNTRKSLLMVYQKPSSSLILSDLPLAMTWINDIPSTTQWVKVLNRAIVSGRNQTLAQLTTCTNSGAYSTIGLCSLIMFENSSFVCVDATMNCSMQADLIEYKSATVSLTTNLTGLTNDHYGDRAIFQCKYLSLSKDSSMFFSRRVSITAKHGASLLGMVTQNENNLNTTNYYNNTTISEVYLTSSGNVTLKNVFANRLLVQAQRLQFPTGSNIRRREGLGTSCVAEPIPTNLTACSLTNTSHYSHLIVLQAQQTVTIGSESLLEGSMIFFCAKTITTKPNITIQANGLGCAAGSGLQPGLTGVGQYIGSGGGGHGGYGGSGQNYGSSGGSTYGPSNSNQGWTSKLYSGSGGGCSSSLSSSSYSCSNSSFGGGIISLRVSNSITLYGNLIANGQSGTSPGSGGGAGGTVSVLASKFTGDGVIKANGGAGSCATDTGAGGGGGGGFVQVFNYKDSYDDFTFSGAMLATGGPAGCTSYYSSSPSSSSSSSSATIVRNAATIALTGGSSATGGTNGVIYLPVCDAGYGNNPALGTICDPCGIGYYSTGNGDFNNAGGTCLECTNAPTHSFYTTSEWGTSQCPYQCQQGYSTDHCYNPFQKFLFDTLGWGGIAGVMIGIFAIILVPLFAYRYKRKRDLENDLKMLKGGSGSSTSGSSDFLNISVLNDLGFGFGSSDEQVRKHRSDRKQGEIHTENPIIAHAKSLGSGLDDEKHSSIRILHPKHGRELRREHRMADSDMPFHAARVNIMGCNHPFMSSGKFVCVSVVL
eukprot:scaffold2642_cov183-Ochromonas_danica.AAC.16